MYLPLRARLLGGERQGQGCRRGVAAVGRHRHAHHVASRASGVHKGGFTKGWFSYNNIIVRHKLLNPPLLNPPL